MSELRQELQEYLTRTYPGATWSALAGDASTRRFYRLTLATGQTRIVMDYGESFTGETNDVRLTALFRSARLPVPEIEAVDGASGCLILQDLGDCMLADALERSPDPEDQAALFRSATLLAVDLAVLGTPVLERSDRADGPVLDVDRFRFEMQFFATHYAGSFLGVSSVSDTLREQLDLLAVRAAQTPKRVLCHRDYHSRNLMVDRYGCLAMVDIQDAQWGPDTYDLASLLFDAYVELPPGLRDTLLGTFRLALPVPPPEDAFLRRFRLVAAERMIKALGTFGYQIAVLGRKRYAEGIPRTVRRLNELLPAQEETALLHQALTEHGLLRSDV